MALINLPIPGLPTIDIPGVISINGVKMQIKKTYPLDNLPLDTTNVLYSSLNAGSVSGFMLGAANSGSLPNTNWYLSTVTMLGGRRWMKGVNNLNCIPVHLDQLGLAWTGKVVIGYRMITESPSNSRTGSFYNSAQTGLANFLGDGTNNNPLLRASQEHYLEIVINFEDFTYKSYVDGILASNATYQFTAANMNTIKTGSFYFWLGAYTNAATNWYIRDLHVREYGPGEAYTPIADATVEGLTVTASAGADWVSSVGGAISDTFPYPMNDNTQNLNLGSLVQPFMEAPKGASAGPLALTLGDFKGMDGQILGMEFLSTLKSLEGVPAAITPKFTQGGVDQTLVKQILTAGYAYRKSAGLVNLAGDGSALTRAKIIGSTLTLTPSAS